jgi:hypothetical protein
MNNNRLTFIYKDCILEVSKTYAGCFSPEYQRLSIDCSECEGDDESYREVHLCLMSDQQDQLQAWLLSKEPELTFTDEDRAMSFA